MLPGEWDWLNRGGLLGGMSTPPFNPNAQGPQVGAGFMDKLNAGLDQLGGGIPLALALMANSSNSTSLGEAFGKSALQTQGMQRQMKEDALRAKYMEAQIRNLDEPNRGAQTPNSVREYEYAKQNGFKGSFQDWVAAGGQSSRPSAITVFEYWDKLDPKRKREMLETMRAPTVKDVGGVPSIVLGTGATNPLSTLPAEVGAIAAKERAKSESGQIGEAQGKVTGGIITKGANAVGTVNTLDLAEPLIEAATGSVAGAARDKLAAVFGEAPVGAQAIAQLKVLQAGLMTQMPRMEGPQSDRDVQLYREAAGQIGDPMVPAQIKKAAVKTIRDIQNKYIERAGGTPKESVKRRRYNPETGKIE
jgi:hypothetical protein